MQDTEYSLSREWRQLFFIFLVTLTAVFSSTYFAITKYDIYDPATGGRTGDVAQYIRMA